MTTIEVADALLRIVVTGERERSAAANPGWAWGCRKPTVWRQPLPPPRRTGPPLFAVVERCARPTGASARRDECPGAAVFFSGRCAAGRPGSDARSSADQAGSHGRSGGSGREGHERSPDHSP